jgi:hypothetical protein
MPAVVRGIHYVSGTVSMDHDGQPQREAPTRGDVQKFTAGLAPDETAALLGRARPAPRARQREAAGSAAGPPVYASWEDFLDRTTPAARMAWCRKKAMRANRSRLMSGAPDMKITGADVWALLRMAVKGHQEVPGGRS